MVVPQSSSSSRLVQQQQQQQQCCWNISYYNFYDYYYYHSKVVVVIVLVFVLFLHQPIHIEGYYYHKPCTRTNQYDFQYPDCYVPDMNRSILFTEASFVLSHDTATGYLLVTTPTQSTTRTDSTKQSTSKSSFSKTSYYKNQIGTMYDQLQNGARAFDLRPYLLRNGTIHFQHDIIHIPISLEQILQDVIRWTTENPTELILLLTSHYAYQKLSKSVSSSSSSSSNTRYKKRDYTNETLSSYYTNKDMVSALSDVYTKYGINYVACTVVYGLTIGEVMDNLAQVQSDNSSKGYIVAMDGQDTGGTFCGKQNWLASTAQQLSCYPTNKVSCQTSRIPLEENVIPYIRQCIKNKPTTNNSQFGPSSDIYHYPLNEIQVLWQITTLSALRGMTHFSSILQDIEKSNIHETIIDMIYNNNEFASYPISLVALDNVAYHGNAIYSVLRNRLWTINVIYLWYTQLEKPKLQGRFQITTNTVIVTIVLLYVISVLVTIRKTKRPKLLFTLIARIDEKWNQSHRVTQDTSTIDPISNNFVDPISKKESFLDGTDNNT